MDANKTITANFSQHFYTWNQTGTASWTTSTNWTPTRVTPATNDVLIFNNGAVSAIVTNVPTQTIAAIQVSGNTNVQLQAAGAVTVTLNGGAGTDLSVASGSTLQLTGANAVTLALVAGTTGSISGTTNLAGSSHRITATDPGSLVYNSGALCATGVSFSGNAFGTTSLNSVVFAAGSLYQHVAGANPFGATAPNSVVTFQAGSRYRMDGPLTPAMAGRTYADFEYNNGGTQSPTGSTAVTMDSLIVSQGTFNLNLTGGAVIRGDIHVKAAGTLSFSPASGAPVYSMAGTSGQSIDIQGAFSTTAFPVLNINNAAGVSLVTNVALNGGLSFTSGLVNTGARTLSLASGSAITGAAQGTGWVNGNLAKTYAAGAFTSTLAVGDGTRYTPVDISGSGAAAGFALTASTTGGEHPNFATSGLDAARSLNRFWTVTSANGAGATWSATFNYPSADVDGTADPLAFLGRAWNGAAWSPLTLGTITANSIQATGVTSATATQFAFGDTPSFTITATAGANGSITPSGAVPVTAGGSQAFTIAANAGFHVADVLVDAVSVGAVTNYSFTNVTANHTIDASFAGDARTLTVNVVGGGVVLKSPDQPTYPNGTSVQLTAVGNIGWTFAAWSGDLVSTTNPDNIVMDAAKTVTATFTDIAAPTVAVLVPNGGDVVTEGTSTPVRWTAADNAAVTAIDIELSRAGVGGPYEPVASGLPNSGTYNWSVTGPVTANALIRVTAHDAAGHTAQDVSDADFQIAGPTGVSDGPVADFALSPVIPNPVRGASRFQFALPREADIRLSVHDVQGREQMVLADGVFAPGRHSIDWTGAGHHALDPGLYFVRLSVPGRTITRRFVLMK
jgi:hypothetical protein